MELDQFKDVCLVIDKANDVFIQRQFVSQGDYKGRSLTVQITNNGSIGEVPGLTLNLNWHNEASGLTDLTAFTILDKKNSIFRIEYPDNMMTPGKVYASIQIIQDGKVTNLQQFELIVQKLAGQPVGIVEKTEFSALVAALADSNKFRTDIDKKADKTYINDYLSKVTAVPETFANLAAIKAKYPNGANGVMVAADNGHKYIWANNIWTDAGVYQSVGIADGSVGNKQLAVPARYGSISSSAPARINSVAKTLTLESVWNVSCGTDPLSVGTNFNVTIALDPDNTGKTGFWIGFLPLSKNFSVYTNPNDIPMDAVYLGWISINKNVSYDLHVHTVEVDGVNTESLSFDKKAVVASKNPFSLDLENKILTPPDGYISIFTSKKTYTLSNRDPVSLDIGVAGCFVYYVISTGSITITNTIVSQSSDLIFLGFISWDSPTPNYDFIFNYTVNGIVPGLGLSFGFANKVGTTFGDSITQGVQLNGATNWTTMLGEKLHLSKITNAGISATTYSKDASRTDSAVERANTIKGQDLIIVWFGINDYHYGRPLGTFENGDVTTVFGAADYVYKTLITNNPTATIVIITPMKQHGYRTYPDSFTKNSAGLLQIDYVNAIKQVADYYSLPVLDFYQMVGMSPFVDVQKAQYFFDGLHPNAAGQYRVAQKIARFIEING